MCNKMRFLILMINGVRNWNRNRNRNRNQSESESELDMGRFNKRFQDLENLHTSLPHLNIENENGNDTMLEKSRMCCN